MCNFFIQVIATLSVTAEASIGYKEKAQASCPNYAPHTRELEWIHKLPWHNPTYKIQVQWRIQ